MVEPASPPDRTLWRDLVRGHEPADARERAAKERFLAELDRLTHPGDPLADPVHVTASAVVVGTRGTVLHLHRRLGRWLQPGGHLEADEHPADAAVRETVEETGLAAHHPPEGSRLIHLDVHAGAQGHTHLDLRYLLLAPADDPHPGPGESSEVSWWSWPEAFAVADEALVGALRQAETEWGSLAAHDEVRG
jgi:8-oxo-dGTP pyrophosphatase MutT (NUDIX family)